MMNNYKIDPRTKLVIILVISTFALIYNDIEVLVVLLFWSVVTAYLMKSNLKSIVFRLKKVIVLMLFIAVVQSLFTQLGDPLIKIGSITLITDYGIVKSAEFILRISIFIVSGAILTTSTSREIVQGMIQWKCPYEIAFMVSVAIRFLPVFTEEMTDMVIAIQLRGVDLKKIKLKQKIKIYKYILLPVLINAIFKAKELSSAMEMRAFRAYKTRTNFVTLKMNSVDCMIIALVLTIAITVLLITIKKGVLYK